MPINTGAFYRFAAYTSFVPTQNRLSFIKGSARNYLEPKRKTNKQMHDFVKVCLIPIDQLSGFRCLKPGADPCDSMQFSTHAIKVA